MDNEFSNLSSYTKQSSSSPKKKAFLYLAFFIVLIGGAIFAGNYFFSAQKQAPKTTVAKKSPTATEAPTPTEQAASPSGTVTPTQKAGTPTETTAAKLRIEVLNGSGTSGEASKMASFLKSQGYAISGTGNALAFDYETTVIQIKKSKTSALAQLKKDLASSYTVDPSTQTLAESAASDAIVIVGAE